MTSYVDVFGGDTVPPSDNRYVAVALTANTTFYWPEQASGPDLMADIMEVTPDAAWDMTFPDATVVSTGRDVLVRNLGASTITLKDSVGGTIGTVAAGVAKYIYLTSNTTAAGTWTIFTFGTGTSAADAATLAGYGLVATGSTLSQETATVTTSGNYTLTVVNRAGALIFNGSGVATLSLLSAAAAGDGFLFDVSNQGTGTVTIDGSGSETIDGATTKDLAPGESATLVCDSVGWVTIGYGRSTQFQFTKLVLDVGTGSPFTLTSVQAENKLLQFIGTVTAGVTVNVPAVVAIYYVQCSWTGAFSMTLKTAAGTGVTLNTGDRSIVYCDGVDVVAAQTVSVATANLSGGAAGQIVYQVSAGNTGYSAAGTAGQIFVSGGTGAPTWSDIGLITDGYSSKVTPADADMIPGADSAAANAPVKFLLSNIKAYLKTYFDTLYASISTFVSRASLQEQTYTAFTTTGTATAYVLTPTPAIAANTTNQRFRVKFHTTAGTTPTLAVSGQTAKSVKYFDGTGAKQAVTATQVPSGWVGDVEYDGTDWTLLNTPSSASTGGGTGSGIYMANNFGGF